MKFDLVERIRRKPCALVFVALLCFGFGSGPASAAQSVTLAWDPSPGSDIAGYNIYYGVASGSYTSKVPVGNVTNATVTTLVAGTTYYFAATAMNTSGLESDPSNEVVYTVPVAPGPTNQAPTLNSLVNISVNQNAPEQMVSLSGITSGSATENQALSVAALSSNPALIPHPTVSYTSPQSTGLLRFRPAPGAVGTATVTVTVSDGQSVNGTTSRSFSVTVQAVAEPPPVITAQPVSQDVVAGADVTLSVIATGTGPFTYQWKKNGAVLSGVTQASLTLTRVNSGHAGSYSVVVSNRGGSATSANAVLKVLLDQSQFVAGSYSGLFFEPNAVSHRSSGSFSLRTTLRRSFSGSLKLEGKRVSFSGPLDAAGYATRIIPRRYQTPVTVTVQLDSADSEKLTGSVSDGTFVAPVIAFRSVYDGRQVLAPQQGRYTLVIPGGEASAAAPCGDSFGTVSVNQAGRIRLAGSLADGTKFSQSAAVSRNGDWPLYVALYSGQGTILSWLAFSPTASTDLSGDVVWIKPGVPRARFYPAGFAVETTASGYAYHRPALGNNVLTLADALLSLAGSDALSLSTQLTIGPRNLATDPNGRRLLTFSPSTGTFSGKVLNPETATTLPFRGVVLQKLNAGTGYFQADPKTGKVTLEALPR